jgi:hypothetical protein
MYRFVRTAFAIALLLSLIPSYALARSGHRGGHGGGHYIGRHVGTHARLAPVGTTVRALRADSGFRTLPRSRNLTHFPAVSKSWSVTRTEWSRHIARSEHHHLQLPVGAYAIPFYSFVGSSYDDNCYWIRDAYGWVRSCDQ